MSAQETEKQLYDAASKGDLAAFQQLIQGDPFLLEVISFAGSRNLLHLATLYGQAAIVEEVLRIHPRLAWSVDSQNSTALHIAAAQGNRVIAQKLLRVAHETCWSRDNQGMNPIHVAAVNGHIEVLEELFAVDPFPAMEKVDRGHTVLHLCVKHSRYRVLEFLVGKLDNNFVETKNDDGETLLHMAVKYNQVEMTKLLAKNTKIKTVSVDSTGRTALDMVRRKPRDSTMHKQKIITLLQGGTEFRAEIMNRMSEVIMLVAVLIATMAFQAAVSPPGGVWQDDSPTHKAGEAVMASTHPKIYRNFVLCNTTALVSSLIAIFLLIARLDSRNAAFISPAVYLTLAAIASIAVSYGASVTVITPYIKTHSLSYVIIIVVAVILGLSGYALAIHLIPEEWHHVLEEWCTHS